ncbi:MAG TPA: hypothetical protein PKD99_16610 [Sphingopyxis sp.]|nr:hypothetical protein [Sphingopyxis sp.]HMP46723.1 hypothetical protein [Sphingopyxis sp.]HMQ19150.1 hypothetical protein [Sphingopyxis sp.]
MAAFARVRLVMLSGVACSILAACGADGVASPGEGVIVIPAPAPAPAPTPTPTPTPTGVTPAAACPSIAGPNALSDLGTISGPQGTWRNCGFPTRFTASTAIPKVDGVIYSLPGRVDVGFDQGPTEDAGDPADVTLTIDPGVTIFGATGVSFLVVNRGNKIDAVGSATQPIVFTGRGNVVGSATDNTSELWGGVVLLGRAPVTDCLAPGATPGTTACERDTEGTSNALYGGATVDDNSGRMSYVQIRYSGFVLSAASELQGLTPSGVGSNTLLENIQVHNSSDDGIEVFGGRVNMRNLVITGAEDDSLDTDMGYKGNIQYVLAVQRAGGAVGDSIMEIDSNGNEDAVPRQNVRISNFTFIHRANAAGNAASILIRGGADYHFMNGVIVAPGISCLRINSATTVQPANPALDEVGPPKFDSVNMQCGGSGPFTGTSGVTNDQVAAIFNGGTNNSSTYTPSLTGLFVNGATETGRPFFNPTGLSSFFQNAGYVGAVRDASDTRFQGWTCNSATAGFGSSSGSCTAIPI